jgi:hypothetical protein
MRFNFDFTTAQVIWTLTFAALLVLLVVLLGRDRARRFPWFTVSIVLLTLQVLASRVLSGRMPQFTLQTIFITLADGTALVGVLVLVELARRAFHGLERSLWIVNSVGLLVVAGAVMGVLGPWPAWKTLTADSHLATLRLMQLLAEKTDLLVVLLTVGLGLLVILFGRRYTGGWRSHAQRLAIGLWTAALARLAMMVALSRMRGALQRLALAATPESKAASQHIVASGEKLINANSAVYLAVLVWWIACFWIDEPGAEDESAGVPAEEER